MKVVDKPVLGLKFDQYRATVTGKLHCLGKNEKIRDNFFICKAVTWSDLKVEAPKNFGKFPLKSNFSKSDPTARTFEKDPEHKYCDISLDFFI